MAGYDGYSKSNNAVDAENEGKFPITKAARIVGKKASLTINEARRVLEMIGRSEYHHTSKFYNRIDYYDTGAAFYAIELSRRLVIPMDELFFKTFRAYGLECESDREELIEAEFLRSYKTEEWR